MRGLPAEVILVALGALPARLAAGVATGIHEALGLSVRWGPLLGRPEYAWNEARRQYHAPAIVRRLSALRGPGAQAPVLGILDGDLFLPEDGEYVLTDADRVAGAGMVGLARLAGEPAAVRRRAQAEAVGVLGHVLGLSGCSDQRCAMYTARDAVDADRKTPALCLGCRAALGLP